MTVKALANRIKSELRRGEWGHCAVYESDLKRVWPLYERDRETKIEQFAKRYGFRLRFYRQGLCAIFDEWPREMRPDSLERSTDPQRRACLKS
jgi:hypothetical protein